MEVFVDANRHIYMRVSQRNGVSTLLTLNGKHPGVSAVKLTAQEMTQAGLLLRDYDPAHVAQTWVRSPLPKNKVATTWLDKILGDKPKSGGAMVPQQLTQEGNTMFYIINKSGELLGVAAKKKEAETDFSHMEESDRLSSTIVSNVDELNAALSGASLMVLANTEGILPEGKEPYVKFKNKAESSQVVWDLLELAHNPKVKAEAEKQAKAAAKAAQAAEKAAAKAPKLNGKAAPNGNGAEHPPKETKEPKAKGGPRGPRTTYAGKSIKVLDSDISKFREGTWTQFMVMAALDSTTTDDAQAKVEHSEYAGRRVDFKWLETKGIIQLQG